MKLPADKIGFEKAVAKLEACLASATKIKADAAPQSTLGDDDLFAKGDLGRERELELAAASASAALDKAAAEIRAVLEEA